MQNQAQNQPASREPVVFGSAQWGWTPADVADSLGFEAWNRKRFSKPIDLRLAVSVVTRQEIRRVPDQRPVGRLAALSNDCWLAMLGLGQ